MGGLLHLVQRGGACRGRDGALPSPLLAVPNVTAHPSTASVPITVLLYGWLRGTVVERWSLTGELSLFCAQPSADG